MASLESDLGARFRELRRDAGLTQAALAERCDVTTETIGRLERGEQIPSLVRLDAIASALGAQLGDLLLARSPQRPRDVAIDRLVALLRRRGVDDATLILDVAERIFRRF